MIGRWPCTAIGRWRTRVDPDAELDLLLGPVAAAEGADGVQQGQSHAGDLPGVQRPVPHGQPRHHHVGVADGLHLGGGGGAGEGVSVC